MVLAVLVVLSGAVLYVSKKWFDSQVENAELRTTIALLKRRLKLASR